MVQQVHHRRRGKLLADRGEPHDVGEEHRHDAAIGLIDPFRIGADQPRDDARIDKLAEGVLDPLLGPQLRDHRIEGGGKLADLVAAVHRHQDREVARPDSLRRLQQPAQCPDHCGSDGDADADPKTGGDRKQHEPHIFDCHLLRVN